MNSLNEKSIERNGLSGRQRRQALVLVMSLFFVWGFMSCLNDILVPKLKSVFELNYFQASFVQMTFFGAYFIMSLPSGKVVTRWGYQSGMIIGLATAAAGALLFWPAASLVSYGVFLAALFVLSSGITLLQVAANPYVSALGQPETASSRLNLAQAFNSLGTTLAPFFGGWLILSASGHESHLGKAAEAAAVKGPYFGLAVAMAVTAVIISCFKLPVLTAVEDDSGNRPNETGDEIYVAKLWRALKIRHLFLGTIAIFLYVGAEVAIGSYLINFLGDPDVAGLSHQSAANYVAYYWGGAMVGRFVGSVLLQKIKSQHFLAFNAVVAVGLLAVGLAGSGSLAMWCVLAIGLFNSIMFPNIFTLAINRLGPLTGEGSSLLIMAIVGGAVIPMIMGRVADWVGIHQSLFIPLLCYCYIVFYGLSGFKVKGAN